MGTAGANYDLELGRIKPGAMGAKFTVSDKTLAFTSPTFVPSTIPRKVESDPGAPLVISVVPNGTITIDDVAGVHPFTYAAPATLNGNATATFTAQATDGSSVPVHALLKRPAGPAANLEHHTHTSVIEDRALPVPLWGSCLGTQDACTFAITRLPNHGALYATSSMTDRDLNNMISVPGHVIRSGVVLYIPPKDQSGEEFDSFGYAHASACISLCWTTSPVRFPHVNCRLLFRYATRLDDGSGLLSDEVTHVISVLPMNDVPVAESISVHFTEDSVEGGFVVSR